ncbi:MAG: signal recognition particle-docking protein FtsY [candidate division NC10 bacterium]|nr:signal recognition particle-docking protein FtsY [candidate division NC10 bacterium]
MSPEVPPAPSGFFSRLRDGLRKTRDGLRQKLEIVFGGAPLDEGTLERLEEALLASDLGPATTAAILEPARAAFRRHGITTGEAMRDLLAQRVGELLQVGGPPAPAPAAPPHVTLFLGVNGSGKTTTIAKLAKRYLGAGERVLLAAGDTFRAAATEQLQIWGHRIGAEVIAHRPGADPAAVIFDACKAASARGVQRLLIDTAGRLHTRKNLMEELKKIHRVIAREVPGAPHETLLVLDATTGLNAVAQAREFHHAVGVTGLVIAKLDGTAKGGAVVAIAQALQLPVRYVGVGESPEDLQPFDPREFAAALFS